jgi:RimJ/RimL family protein N-acetyltransferase
MKTSVPFVFLDPGRLVDGDLELVLAGTAAADPGRGYVPAYQFQMRQARTGEAQIPGAKLPGAGVMGRIHLRIGSAAKLRYPGHIGYVVDEPFRGHRYAARSCLLLLPLARAHGLRALWLTVHPDNVASQRTCQLIGARYVQTVRIPRDHEMYAQGARYRRRYRLDI